MRSIGLSLLILAASPANSASVFLSGHFPSTTEIISGPQPGQIGPEVDFSILAEWTEPFSELYPGIYTGMLQSGNLGAFALSPGTPVYFFTGPERLAFFGRGTGVDGEFDFSFDLNISSLKSNDPNSYFGLRSPFPIPFTYRYPQISEIRIDDAILSAPPPPLPLPEPRAWLLMLAGMAFVGGSLRLSRRHCPLIIRSVQGNGL